MSTLFVLLDYCIIILISTLYNPSHCLSVRTNRGQVYAWFGFINSFKIDALCCCCFALEYFTFSGFSTNVVCTENWFVCVLLSCCYTCFVYAWFLCCRTFQLQVLWWRLIKVMLTIVVQEHTPYSNSWQVKIHDLCKISWICSSYAFGFIRPNELLNLLR